MKLFSILLLLTTQLAQAKVDTELSGNVEAQARRSWNNSEASDLQQNWSEEDFFLLYGNLNGKAEFKGSRLEANWFLRHSHSQLYRQNYLAPKIYTFPNTLVARNVFKLEHKDENSHSLTESVLNKLYYEWDYDEHRFMVGRMYINYGTGEIFNPLNPFNQPTALTSIQQIAQGNDGLNFTFFVNDHHTVAFYILGDKNAEDYRNQITKTLWIHGEYQVSDQLQLTYVLGEDQKRDKVGGEISYQFEKALTFAQVLYQSDYVDDKQSESLWDALLGYDQQLSATWHLRFEGGYQEKNNFSVISFSNRFLPTEYFAALALSHDIHPLVKINGTVINDIKSGFTYLVAKTTFNLGHNTEAEIFGYLPAAKGDSIENPAQKLITTDMGLALRAFF